MSQAQGSELRLIVADELTFKSSPEVVVENCEAAWDELVDADVTESLDAVDYKVGSGSAKFVCAVGLGAGDIIATHDRASLDISSYEYIGGWIKSTVALDAGDLQILIDDTANCASPLESLDIPAVAANTWTWFKVAMSDPSLCTAVISVGLKQIVDKEAMTINIDDVRALNAAHVVAINSESIRQSRNLLDSAALRGNRNPYAPVRGNVDVGGDLVFELDPYMGKLLKHLCGTYSVTGSSPYVHTFKIGSLPTGFMVEKGFTDIDQYIVYNGCRVSTMSLSVRPEGFIEGRLTVLGSKETVNSDGVSFCDDPIDDGHTGFDGFEASITEGGASLGNCTSVDLNVDNDLDNTVYVIGGAGEREAIPSGIVKVNGTVTVMFENVTLYNKAVNNTETSLVITLTKGTGAGTAGNEKLTITIQELIFRPQAPVVPGSRGVFVELAFVGYYGNHADASAIKFVLENTRASYNDNV